MTDNRSRTHGGSTECIEAAYEGVSGWLLVRRRRPGRRRRHPAAPAEAVRGAEHAGVFVCVY